MLATLGEAAAAKRVAKTKIRAIITPFRERPKHKIPVELLAFRRRDAFLVDRLHPRRATDWLGPLVRARQGADLEISLRDFNFLDQPEETLTKIQTVLKAETGAADIRLHFDDERCQDIAPYLLLAMMWDDLAPIFNGGRMTAQIQRVIEAVRLRRPLKMRSFRHRPDDKVNAFPLHRRRAANRSTSSTRHLDPQTREEVQDGFVSTLNNWLGHPEIDMELTADGRGNIKNIIGEILDNAERHSMPLTMDGDWSIAGFMAKRTDGIGDRFECSIGFISAGETISGSLKTSPPAVTAEVDKYVERHRRSVPAEVLRTVMSIQDGITRVPESAAEHRGGTGFQDVLELVNELGATNLAGCEAKVTVVSGSACLKLHPPYSLGTRRADDRFSPRQIWFNPENDAAGPPDDSFAFGLKHPFPGTIVTMGFVFQPSKLEKEDVDHD